MKTLIIQTAFLGDVVLTLPLIQSAKINLKSGLYVLCIPSTKDILEGHPSVDGIIVTDKKGRDKGFLNLLKLGNYLKKEKFDIVLVPHPSFQSALLSYLSGSKRRVGFSNNPGRLFFTDIVPFDKKKHQLERYLDILTALDISPKNEKTVIYVDGKNEKWAADILGNESFLIGINPGSVWETKRWLPERFAEVADRLVSLFGGKAVIVGGSGDVSAADSVERRMSSKPVNLTGKTTLKQLSALIKRCRVFITNDSGPMHIAAAFDVPTVAIFGPTVKEFGFFPYSQKSIVVENNVSCRPCGKHGPRKCPGKTFACMSGISSGDVIEAAKKLVGSGKNV